MDLHSVLYSRTGASRPSVIIGTWTALLILVTVGELLPGNAAPMKTLSDIGLSDIAMHFGAYAVLAFVPTVGLPLKTIVRCLLVNQLVGVALEFGQALVPGRSCDPYDAIANTVGLVAGAIIAGVVRSRLARRRQAS